jgi:serine/threonine protein kinase
MTSTTTVAGLVPSDLVDPEDGEPVWDFPTGHEVFPGVLAAESLGVGHRCETWLVWLRTGWHPAVLKLPRPHQQDHPRARAALERERAGLLAGAGHPAYPRLVSEHVDAHPPYLVMEYLDGPSLAEIVDEHGPLAVSDAALLGAALLPALLVLHRAGLVHVDVKSENVLVPDGHPYLVDFGSARELGRPQPAGRPVGTSGYAAPELEACEPIATSMDLYGLGTVLAESLTGKPFPDGAPLPAGPLTPLVERLLDPDPGRRGSAPEILRELAELVPDDQRPWPSWADAYLPD